MTNKRESDNSHTIIASIGDSFVYGTVSGSITNSTVRNIAKSINQVGKDNNKKVSDTSAE